MTSSEVRLAETIEVFFQAADHSSDGAMAGHAYKRAVDELDTGVGRDLVSSTVPAHWRAGAPRTRELTSCLPSAVPTLPRTCRIVTLCSNLSADSARTSQRSTRRSRRGTRRSVHLSAEPLLARQGWASLACQRSLTSFLIDFHSCLTTMLLVHACANWPRRETATSPSCRGSVPSSPTRPALTRHELTLYHHSMTVSPFAGPAGERRG